MARHKCQARLHATNGSASVEMTETDGAVQGGPPMAPGRAIYCPPKAVEPSE